MEFALSEDQRLLQDSLAGTLASLCPLDEVRKVADGDRQTRDAIARGLNELGIHQILVPETHGGLGLGLLEAALAQEALGAAVSPAPCLGTAMAAAAIRAGADDAQKADWLGRIAAGEARFAIAAAERTGARAGAGIAAGPSGLTGKSLFAIEADTATHILAADDEGGLHIVEAGAAGLGVQAMRTIDRTRVFSEVSFDNTPRETLAGGNRPGRASAAMIAVGRVLVAADTLGAAQAMLDKAVTYAGERKQFNRVIASFQAVKHMCAEMAGEIEPARGLVWLAAHAGDEGQDDSELFACLAKSHLAEIGTFVARTATEVHGGMGFTDLMGLHYWFKRIGVNRQLLGGPERVREDAARLQGWA
ncbi:MAG: acyl-CoA dehydrogenase [Alphaproteobacteria bacterium]|jgi:alkylation response protein AidB-like acyl-CoA dehydrogenase|nr:acyl-CoA dehydrogenase [Alphaproteobacteria bacterium]